MAPPPEEYSYQYSRCGCEIRGNDAIIDFNLGFAEFERREVGYAFNGIIKLVAALMNNNSLRQASRLSADIRPTAEKTISVVVSV